MQRQGPPSKYHGTPNAYTLNAGERLWRVHSRQYGAGEFNPVAADEHFGGGRFDGTKTDPYPFFYAGAESSTALAEVFLRDELRFTEWGYRLLQWEAVRSRRISMVETTYPLTLLSLRTGPDLAAVAASAWLVQGAANYGESRAVARWLRERTPWSQGLIWTSTIDLGKPAVVLFGDRCDARALREVPGHAIDLDDGPGISWLNAALAPYRTEVRRPRRWPARRTP
jgi:hypothetical protein